MHPCSNLKPLTPITGALNLPNQPDYSVNLIFLFMQRDFAKLNLGPIWLSWDYIKGLLFSLLFRLNPFISAIIYFSG